MKGFERENRLFSLCGLNCALCPMQLDGYCPGCGGGAGNQSCTIARCSLNQGGLQYCFQCSSFPCGRYREEEYDSFLPHRNRLHELDRVSHIGEDAYQRELEEKREILLYLLEHYNDGRKKSLFCVAANLLELAELQEVVHTLMVQERMGPLTQKERAALAARLLREQAGRRGIELKLRKKPSKKKTAEKQ